LIPKPTDSFEHVRLGAAWADIATRPYEYFVRRWNWKSAVTSALLRGAIFFSANLTAGRKAAVAAMLTEFGYRFLFSGGVGSITQALRKCEPAWGAALTASVAIPIVSHAVELSIHLMRGTPKIRTSIGASVIFTVLSTLFNLYLMRRNVLVVGDKDRKTLAQDMAAIPGLLAGFLAAGPIAIWKCLRPLPESKG
jgi:hypothetical protein